MGVSGFELGWKIGRTVDTKWLHISALAADVGYSVNTGYISDGHGVDWEHSGSEWQLRVGSSWGWPCANTSTFVHVTDTAYRNDLYGSDRTVCSQFARDAYNYIATLTIGATEAVSCGFLASLWTPAPSACYRVVLSDSQMESRVSVTSFRDYQSGDESSPGITYTHATTGFNPSYSSQGFASQAAQDQAAIDVLNADPSRAAGMFVDHVMNPSGSVPDPLVDFTWLAADTDETYDQWPGLISGLIRRVL